jgi:polyisoprenyl-teichoic acid--peptidoglycan teichoic acid transferase
MSDDEGAGTLRPRGEKSRRKVFLFLLITGVLSLVGILFLLNPPYFTAVGQIGAASPSPQPEKTVSLLKDTPVPSPSATGTPPPEAAPTRITPPRPTSTPTTALPTPDPWKGDRRVNILLLGLDYADWDSPDRQGPPRSDTMILLSVDPVSKSAATISIPRDLWVDIPGMIRPNKINAAHRFGELYNLPGGGPALAAKTVEQILGVSIDYYARIDFSSFERMIDEIGGIEVDVPEEIKVDPIGPNNTVVLQPGKQLLDGPVALAYARNRYTAGDDFDRARRQQQVMLAVRSRLLQFDRLPRTILKAPALYRELDDGIVTNLPFDKAIQLAWLIPQIKSDHIYNAVIGPNQIIVDVTEDGQSIYVPRFDRIRYLVEQTFAGSPP